MEQTEVKQFFILVSISIAVLIVGIVIFIFQYRKRKLLHEKEKILIEEQHRLDLLRMQLESQDQTMQFIGREIHDSVAQKLTLASIYTQKLEYENQHPEITVQLENISAVINDSLHELRDLSKTLTDNKMHDTCLLDLLSAECERINETGICCATLQFTFEENISVTVKSFLLRVVQEFLQNSLKHSEGTQILVNVEKKDGGLLLNASDDGKGFDSRNTRSRGIGLTNMERRVQLIGGSFNLQSELGSGTHLEIFIPQENLCSK